ncbi:MAG: pseudouridine synthase [Bacteroidia bacterium]|jgi:23S rRNA pseudouridine2605 synthase|nr:pseudouridine synthase [Bacteroidia bacterium]
MKEPRRPSEEESSAGAEPIRLNKYISNAGVCSRRAADKLIADGKVRVNGKVITNLGTKVTLEDKVKVDNELISTGEKLYVLVNKPRNCISTRNDEKGRRSIMDLLPDKYQHLYPVGRLDRNTTGIILMTNDGTLTQNLLHPTKKINKVYKAKVKNQLSQLELNQMVDGIELEDGLTKFDKIVELNEDESFRYGIEIHSGKNRVIRRMFESIDNEVIKLDRVMFHTFTKKGIPIATFREVTKKELKNLDVYLRTKK